MHWPESVEFCVIFVPLLILYFGRVAAFNFKVHLIVCLTSGPKPLPNGALHAVRSRASSIKWDYTVLSLSSSSSFLRLRPRFYVTSIPPFIFHLITRCRRQNVTKPFCLPFTYFMQDIPLILDSKSYFFISHMIGPTDLFHPSPAPHFKTFQLFLIYCPQCPSFSTI
jgi:hypothetical protein